MNKCVSQLQSCHDAGFEGALLPLSCVVKRTRICYQPRWRADIGLPLYLSPCVLPGVTRTKNCPIYAPPPAEYFQLGHWPSWRIGISAVLPMYAARG